MGFKRTGGIILTSIIFDSRFLGSSNEQRGADLLQLPANSANCSCTLFTHGTIFYARKKYKFNPEIWLAFEAPADRAARKHLQLESSAATFLVRPSSPGFYERSNARQDFRINGRTTVFL